MLELSGRLSKWIWSLRARTFMVVCIVTAAPLAFVLCSTFYEQLLGRLLVRRTQAALQAAEAGRTPARDERVTLVQVAPSGQVRFFGEGAHRAQLSERVRTHQGRGTRCEVSADGLLHVCASWHTAADGTLLYTEASDRRSVRSLLDDRAALLKLTLLILPASLLLAFWLGRHMVQPIERLRSLVHERADSARPRADLPVERPDEIGDLARSFNLLIARLLSRQEANEAFMQDLAHELKSPVAAVRACAERLAEDSAPDVARAQRLARVLRDSGQKLESVLEDFLELAGAEGGMRGEEHVAVDMSRLLSNLVEGARARHDQLAWELALADGVVCVGVAPRIEAALGHLLDNAAAFARARVSICMQAGQDLIEMSVADDGPGIAPEHLAQVFERFFTRRAGHGGTGLGLAVAQAIALAHAGHLRVDSTLGAGARFTLTLPRSRRARAAAAPGATISA